MFSQLYLLLTLTFLCSAVDFNCPGNGFGFYPHPDSCDMFIMCNFGYPVEQKCDAGLLFNPAIGLCDLANNVACERATFALTLDCPNITLGFYPHPEDCEKFLVCQSGSGTVVDCPPDLHFNPVAEICEDPETAGCASAGPVLDCPPDTPLGFYPHPESCEKFLVCQSGSATVVDCPPDLHFSPTNRSCVDQEIAGCEITDPGDPGFQCPDSPLAFYPHPESCEKFILCQWGIQTEVDCPPDMHFSPDEDSCLDAEIAGCEIGVFRCPNVPLAFYPHPESCNKFLVCQWGIETVVECPAGMHFSPDKESCLNAEDAGCEVADPSNPGDPVIDCSLPGEYHIPYPISCSMYITCSNGVGFVFSCPEGSLFDPETAECVDRDNVDCILP